MDMRKLGVLATGGPDLLVAASKEGSLGTLATAAGYVMAATWILGVQIFLHGRDFLVGFLKGDPTSMTSACVALIAGSLAALVVRHHSSEQVQRRGNETVLAELARVASKLDVNRDSMNNKLAPIDTFNTGARSFFDDAKIGEIKDKNKDRDDFQIIVNGDHFVIIR